MTSNRTIIVAPTYKAAHDYAVEQQKNPHSVIMVIGEHKLDKLRGRGPNDTVVVVHCGRLSPLTLKILRVTGAKVTYPDDPKWQ